MHANVSTALPPVQSDEQFLAEWVVAHDRLHGFHTMLDSARERFAEMPADDAERAAVDQFRLDLAATVVTAYMPTVSDGLQRRAMVRLFSYLAWGKVAECVAEAWPPAEPTPEEVEQAWWEAQAESDEVRAELPSRAVALVETPDGDWTPAGPADDFIYDPSARVHWFIPQTVVA